MLTKANFLIAGSLTVGLILGLSGCGSQTATVPSGAKPPADQTNIVGDQSVVPDSGLPVVRSLLANKLDKELEQIFVPSYRETADFMRGLVAVGQADAKPQTFLARREGDNWELVYVGVTAVPCAVITQYKFPADLAQCE